MSNLDGWDIAFVAEADTLNGPTGFFSIQDVPFDSHNIDPDIDPTEYGAQPWALKAGHVFGVIDQMAIAPGGSQNIIFVHLKLKSGGFVAHGGHSLDLTQAVVRAQVQLDIKKQTSQRNPQVVLHSLKGHEKSHDPITVVSGLRDGSGPIDGELKQMIDQSLMLTLRLCSFDFLHVLADLIPKIGTTGQIDMKSVAPIYNSSGPSDTGQVCVLAVFQDTPKHVLTPEIPHNAQPSGSDLMVVTTLKTFSQRIVAPTMAKQFDLNVADFSCDDFGNIICSKTVKLKPVKKLGVHFSPEVTSFKANPDGGQLKCHIEGKCSLHAGISITFQADMKLSISVDKDTGALKFALVGKPKVTHSMHLSWYDFALLGVTLAASEIGLVIAGIIVATVETSVSDAVESSAPGQVVPNAIANSVTWNFVAPSSKHSTELVQYTDVNLGAVLRIDAKAVVKGA